MKVLAVVLLAAVCVVMVPEVWCGLGTTGKPVTTKAFDYNWLYKYYYGNANTNTNTNNNFGANSVQSCQVQCQQRGYPNSYEYNGWCYCNYQQTNWGWSGGFYYGDD